MRYLPSIVNVVLAFIDRPLLVDAKLELNDLCDIPEARGDDPCEGDPSEAFYCRNLTSVCHACRQKCEKTYNSPEELPRLKSCQQFCEEYPVYDEELGGVFIHEYYYDISYLLFPCENQTSVCQRCFNCDEDPDVEECLPRCKCTSHDDCNSDEFCCKRSECIRCDECDPTSPSWTKHPIDNVCPSHCFCSATSGDCSPGKYCSTRGYNRDNDGEGKEANLGKCIYCDDCKDRDVVGGSKCTDVCSSSLKCHSTLECRDNEWCWSKSDQYFNANENSFGFGSSCRKFISEPSVVGYENHLSCWMMSSWGRSTCPDCHPTNGFSFGCPKTICDKWSLEIGDYGNYLHFSKWYIPFCNVTDEKYYFDLKAGWMRGNMSNLSAEEFAEKSNSCSVIRHNAPEDSGLEDEHWPKSVVAVDCTESASTDNCGREMDNTVAIWYENHNSAFSPLLEYYDQHPIYRKRNLDYSCLNNASGWYIIIGSLVGGILMVCGVVYMRKVRRERLGRHNDGEE